MVITLDEGQTITIKEEWREYNGYKVSNYGKVINKHGKLLTLNADKHGYIGTSITDYDKSRICGLHRIIATVFIPNPNNLPEVNHIDGVKANNKVNNLEWCTHEYNMQHEVEFLKQRNCEKHWFNILTEEKVKEIHKLCKDGEIKYKDIAKLYGIFPQEVSDIAKGVLWRDLKLEPLPPLIRGARGRSKKVIWINEDKEYTSIIKCSDDLRNTYGIIVTTKSIGDICSGKLEEWKGQQFKYI